MQSGSAQSYSRSWAELLVEYEQEQRKSLPNPVPISDPLLRRIKEVIAGTGIGSIDVNILLLIKINFTSSSSNEPLKIARAFRAVETYALNLFHRFWKKEYYRLKRYGGFFKTYVDAYLKGVDIVFHKMGYTLSDDETEWQMVGPTQIEWATELAPTCISIAFYCCVAAVECEYVASVCSELGQRNTPGCVFLHRLDNPATPRVTVQQLRQKSRTGTTAVTVATTAIPDKADAGKQKQEPLLSLPPSSGGNIASYYGNTKQKDHYDVPAVAGGTASAPAGAVGNRQFPASSIGRAADSGTSALIFDGSSSPTRGSHDVTARLPIYRHAAASGISGSAAAAERMSSGSNRTSEYGRHDPIEMSEPLAPPQSLYSESYLSDVSRLRNSTFGAARADRDSSNRVSWETEAATADEHMALSLKLLDNRYDISPFPPPPTAFSSDALDISDSVPKPLRAPSNDLRHLGTSDLGSAARSPHSVTTRVGEASRSDAGDFSMADFSIREPPPYSAATNAVGAAHRYPVVSAPSTSGADAKARVSSAAAARGTSAPLSDANKSALFSPRSAEVAALQSEAGNDGLYVFNRIGP